ncbi:hypothetical protein Mapa_003547 [Marchantia paleacea]|nr:hypothetical protein Mapa_003547 [Marchantia paleacea]
MPDVVCGFRYYAGWADKIHGATLPTDSKHFAYTSHDPLGVVGTITPWNFPMIMFGNKVAPPKVCAGGITPPGVLNVVSGYGEALSRHPDVDSVSFIDSTALSRLIMEAAAKKHSEASESGAGWEKCFPCVRGCRC